jgi:ribose 5-phosphate isomerase A
MTTQDQLKLAAALNALDNFVESGMRVGLGSGSTAEIFVTQLGQRVQQGLLRNITCVATSKGIEYLARNHGLEVYGLNEVPALDLTVDGADEVERESLYCTKGRGGALLREKMVAAASRTELIIVDESKLVNNLGEKMPIPVEVIPFGWRHTSEYIVDLGGIPVLRLRGEEPYVTDNGNYILDCQFPPITAPEELSVRIKNMVGVVEHGLFVGLVEKVIIAGNGGSYVLSR